MLELFHRYCDPTTIAFDACAGTCVSVLAMLYLGLQGIVNDRDAECLALGEARARVYMDHLFKENDYQYPDLGDSHKQVYDGTNLYGWVADALGYTTTQRRRVREGSRVLFLPPTNAPSWLPLDEDGFEKVLPAFDLVVLC